MVELRKLNNDEKHKWLSSHLGSDKSSLNEIDSELLINDFDSVYSGEEHNEETECDIEFE